MWYRILVWTMVIISLFALMVMLVAVGTVLHGS